LIQTGIAVSSIKRDLDQEKEAKKNAIAAPEEGGKEGAKQPKMKRVVVRGKR
jgi:signal recognition particle subunit SRP19